MVAAMLCRGPLVVCLLFIGSALAAESKIVLTDKMIYSAQRYTATLNPWGAEHLVSGKDYTQTISLNPDEFPNDVQINWSWKSPGRQVMSYPHVKYVGPSASQVANFATLKSNYDLAITGDIQHFNVCIELWLTSKVSNDFNTTTHEIMIVLHEPDSDFSGNQPYKLSDGGLSRASVFVHKDWGIPNWHQWTFVVIKNPVDKLSGSINLADILRALIWNGVLTGREYAAEIQLGAEVRTGVGALNINSLSYEWMTKPPMTMSASFTADSVGGNHIVGGLDTEVVTYAAPYSSFQVKQYQDETLVVRKGNISSLDVLEGIKSVRFSDGAFDPSRFRFTSDPQHQ
jgi:hypothetical protein